MTLPNYEGDPNAYPSDFAIPDDSDPEHAASVNVALEALGDRTAFLRAKVGCLPALTFQTLVDTTHTFTVLKYSEVLERWFALGTNVFDYAVTTQTLLAWPTVTEVPGPELLGNTVWDFDLDAAGVLLMVDQGIDNIRKRTAAGVWSIPAGAGEGDNTEEPSILFEPVSGKWVLAFQVASGGAGNIIVRTSSDTFATHANHTAPTFPAGTKVSLASNATGRVVMQGFLGTNTYFSYSDDAGSTWSVPTVQALGFAYNAGAAHHPKPVFDGTQWVAVAYSASTHVSRVFKSLDGVTWTVAASLATVGIAHIAHVANVILGTTAGGLGGALGGGTVHSTDGGVTWRKGEGNLVFAGAYPAGVAATPSRFVVMGSNQIYPGIAFGVGGGLVT